MNMRKAYITLLFCLALTMWVWPFQAASADTNDQLNQMQETIDKLEQKIKLLETRRSGTGGAASNEDVAQDIDHILDRLDKVETKTILDKICIGAELRTRSDFFTFEDNTDPAVRMAFPGYGLSGTEKIDEDVNNLISTRFRLNLRADVSDNMKFHARLTSYYNWSDLDTPAFSPYTYSRTRSDSGLKVERAFMDYFFESIPAAFSMGRLPMSDSLPSNLKDNTARKSIYPALLYDMEMDGMAVSFFLDKWLPLKDPVVRMVYIHGTSEDNDNYFFRDEDSHTPDGLNVFVTQWEAGLPASLLEDSIIIVSWLNMPKVAPLSPAQLEAQTGVPVTSVDVPNSLGTINQYVIFFQSERFLGSWVDIFAGYKYQDFKADGDGASYLLDYSPGPIISFYQGGFSNTENKDSTANARHLGCRINFPIEPLNNPKLGVSYSSGSKNVMAGATGTEGLDDVDVVGDAWDVYYIQPISKNFMMRIGYTTMDVESDSTLWWYGSRPELDQKITNSYLLFDMGF